MNLILGGALGSPVVQAGPAWWQTLLAAIGGGVLALVGTVSVGVSDRRSSRNAEWFRRVQWAQRLTAAGEISVRAAGYRALDYLSESRLAGRDDQLLLERLAMSPALEHDAASDLVRVDQTAYVMDNGSDGKVGSEHDESD